VVPTDLSLTTCPEAAEQFRLAVDQLLTGDPAAAVQAFTAAVVHDPGFALGYAGLAAVAPDDEAARTALAEAQRSGRRISRRERQQVSIIELVLAGRLPRASALGREHLGEFPDDTLILHVLAQHCDDLDDLRH
jgi:hypothetical protein